MANYATLKAAIQNVVKTNGNNEITGALLQQSLLSMITSLGAGCQYMGKATSETTPGTPDQNVFYIAGPGTYPNFSNAVVNSGFIGVFKYNGSWTIETVQAGKDYDDILYNEEYTPINHTTIGNSFINSAGNLVEFSSYDVFVYPVGGISHVKFNVHGAVNDLVLFGFYASNDISSANLVQIGPHPTNNEFTQTVEVPAGSTYLAVTSYRGNQYTEISSVTFVSKLDDLDDVVADVAKLKLDVADILANITTDVQDSPELSQTISNHFVRHSDGAIIELSSYDVRVFDVQGYKTVRIVVTGAVASDSLAAYAFYSGSPSAGTVIQIGPGSTASYDYTLTVPANAKYIATSFRHESSQRITVTGVRPEYKDNLFGQQIAAINAEMQTLGQEVEQVYDEIMVDVDTPKPVDSTLEHQFISSSGNATAFDSYNILLYSMAGIDRVHIVANTAVSSLVLYGFYRNTEISSANLVQLGPTPTGGNYDQIVDVPAGAAYLAVTSWRNNQTTTISKVTKESKLDSFFVPPIKYLIDGQSIYLATNAGQNDFVIKLGPTVAGIGNGLIDFRQFATQPHSDKINIGSLVTLHSSSSDWFGPWKIKAKNNIDGDDPTTDAFTGGSHRYNNGISGTTPTARLDSVNFYIDGNKVTAGSGSASFVKIVWTNYVQAMNTKKENGTGREVLKETITLTFDGVVWRAFNEIVPLEDLTLVLYYGYQFTGVGAIFTHWRFVNATNRGMDALESGNKNTLAVLANGTMNIEMTLDETVDFGKRDFCTSGTTRGAFQSGSKMYFTIANNNGDLAGNANYFMSGSYKIELTQ